MATKKNYVKLADDIYEYLLDSDGSDGDSIAALALVNAYIISDVTRAQIRGDND